MRRVSPVIEKIKKFVCPICNEQVLRDSLSQKYCRTCGQDKTKRDRFKKYGLADYSFKKLLKEQGGLCSICGGIASVVDHDHKTGKVRGILCSQCNMGLGMFKENTVSLTSAIDYLKDNGIV